ncbi:hypothetical protein LV89_03842 [Arcicella aurantiaca]|uniref:Uncharacterized protein n=1 Tax=Arcicella aurantiaca TaxID=591202 RepID=A0A316DSY3_9BACT|nr:hypothetical protein [Arcicella aurantiaca]PWK20299.1 hypothetical protein LV89_03842 [Arcicella aurantiaca]
MAKNNVTPRPVAPQNPFDQSGKHTGGQISPVRDQLPPPPPKES